MSTTPIPTPFTYATLFRSKPIHLFAREPSASLQVWSGEWGYPGDGWYLELHKRHYPGGHRYWRVTARGTDLAEKAEYSPEIDRKSTRLNSSHVATTYTVFC